VDRNLARTLEHDHAPEDAYERVLDRIEAEELRPLLSGLSRRERDVLRLRFGSEREPLSRREVAEALGLSESRVRDLERRAPAKLRRAARTHGLDRDAAPGRDAHETRRRRQP
jgi:RNA polymerase sigma factor (sigma-70 family)